MLSTLNQMVNYIPLKHYAFSGIYNITVTGSDYATNKKWDENLQKVFEAEKITFHIQSNEYNLKIEQDKVSDIGHILETLEANFSDKKIFWNITGGQRPFVLAIQQIAKADDVICYLEGNKSQMVLLQNGNEIKDMPSYDLECLNIETALKLMGFDIKETKTSHRNLLKNNDETEKTFYLEFLKKYIKNETLRKNCILLNRDDKKEDAKKEIKKIISIKDEELNQNKAFGYILEKLAGYKILEFAKDKIADITFGEKINHLRPEDKADEYHIDEFDIALLTKNGKFMIFECKSGGMSGDVAKSTKYSTYAVSGVYGKPILITPLLEKEIEEIRKESHLKDSSFEYLKDDLYKTIRQAINSAIRAGLEVWGIDEIEENLKKYIG